MAVRYGFRRVGDDDDFDGFAPEELLELLLDDLLETGDLDEVLDRLIRYGFTAPDGTDVEGLADLLEQARAARAELEAEGDPEAQLTQLQQRLAEIEAIETASIDELLAEAEASGDERRHEVTKEFVNDKQLQRELMPDDFGGRMMAHQDYDFVSSEARERFEELLEEIRRDVLNTYFEANKEFFQNPDPEAMAEMRAMMEALSDMLEQRRRGEPLDPTFEAFMDRYGDYFPGAETLDDVVSMMAERAAAAEAMFNALSAEQQAELRGLFSSILEDLDLNLAMQRLIGNLRQETPDLDWNRTARYRGGEPSRFADAADRARRAAELSRLEKFMQGNEAASRLPEIDVDAVRRNLGPDAARTVERLQQTIKGLRDHGLVDRSKGSTTLTARGMRKLAGSALRDLFRQLKSSTIGAHRQASTSRGHDREETTKPWEPGQPLNLHLPQTLRNAVFRQGPGTPVRLLPEDFAVEEHEAMVRSATVICVDLSLSMEMRGNLAPAKKMVLALSHLISTAYPRDFVKIVGFGETAHEIKLEDVPFLNIDYAYGTNLQHALALSRTLLRGERGTKQIIVVTDGEPTAHLTDSGEPFFSWPPVHETMHRTMAEVLRCTKADITINTFALDIERSQFPFVDQIARVNGGRTFYTDNQDLGRYVLDDFVTQRKKAG